VRDVVATLNAFGDRLEYFGVECKLMSWKDPYHLFADWIMRRRGLHSLSLDFADHLPATLWHPISRAIETKTRPFAVRLVGQTEFITAATPQWSPFIQHLELGGRLNDIRLEPRRSIDEVRCRTTIARVQHLIVHFLGAAKRSRKPIGDVVRLIAKWMYVLRFERVAEQPQEKSGYCTIQ
jgi:hypothetical protein